jgi:hypothetical protein
MTVWLWGSMPSIDAEGAIPAGIARALSGGPTKVMDD